MELHSRIAGRERTLSVIAPAGSEKKNGGCCVSITFSFVASDWHTHCSSTVDDVSAFNVAATVLRRAFFCSFRAV